MPKRYPNLQEKLTKRYYNLVFVDRPVPIEIPRPFPIRVDKPVPGLF